MTYTSVTVLVHADAPDGTPFPAAARLMALWNRATDRAHFSIDARDGVRNEDLSFNSGEEFRWSGDPADEAWIGVSSKRGFDGPERFAADVSRRYPGVAVHVRTDYDEDEPGTDATIYRDGTPWATVDPELFVSPELDAIIRRARGTLNDHGDRTATPGYGGSVAQLTIALRDLLDAVTR